MSIVNNPTVLDRQDGKLVVRLRFNRKLHPALSELLKESLTNGVVFDTDGMAALRLFWKDEYEMRLVLDSTVEDYVEPPYDEDKDS